MLLSKWSEGTMAVTSKRIRTNMLAYPSGKFANNPIMSDRQHTDVWLQVSGRSESKHWKQKHNVARETLDGVPETGSFLSSKMKMTRRLQWESSGPRVLMVPERSQGLKPFRGSICTDHHPDTVKCFTSVCVCVRSFWCVLSQIRQCQTEMWKPSK